MVTIQITLKGLVQGIGFRPFVAELAEKLHIRGWVCNTAGVVTVLACADRERLEEFRRRLLSDAPKGARPVEADVSPASGQSVPDGFLIIPSRKEDAQKRIPDVPADLATCKRCCDELNDKKNRRYRHPFISCTACGPRYSILDALPYDRENTAMGEFAMCPACKQDYAAPGNPRRHAQTVACRDCGPLLHFTTASQKTAPVTGEAALSAGIDKIKAGGILAVKDIGGYHLACLPDCNESVAALRKVKGREKKPFAVMFLETEQIKRNCTVENQEQSELESDARPIVLLKKKESTAIAKNVCENSPYLGAMLPCNPLQILLILETGPLVMTSANRSGGLIITKDDEMLWWAERIWEEYRIDCGILSHTRGIRVPLDDSVVRIVMGRRQIFRRARGFVPTPVNVVNRRAVFAAGGDLKACFAYIDGQKAVLSGPFGDLEEESCYAAWERETHRMKALFGAEPEAVITDLHPDYVSARAAKAAAKREKIPHKQVQHHMAHVASVIAEHRLSGPVFGVAMDGTGYGTDKTVWGGEFFSWDGAHMRRVGHLKSVLLPGGNAGVKNAESILYAYLTDAGFDPGTLTSLFSCAPWLSEEKYRTVSRAVSCRVNVVRSSSMGRLFDAVSALLGVCLFNGYEGQAPTELEYLAAAAKTGYPLHIPIDPSNKTGDAAALFFRIVEALQKKADRACLAKGFIDAVAVFIYDMVKRYADTEKIVLSGGTFQNGILTEQVIRLLEAEKYEVYLNEQVPSGDGGLCIGQAYLYEYMEE